MMWCLTWRPMWWSGDSSCQKRWNQQFALKNLIAGRNTNFEEIKMLFDITLRLIVENSFEIMNSSPMIQDFSPWMRSTLCHDQAIKWTKAKVNVYSDSVLCLGKMHGHSEANENWKKPDKRISTIKRIHRVLWNRRRPTWVRVKYFPRSNIDWDSQRDPERSEHSTNKSRTIWWKICFHVNVQRHSVDKE